jgi:hypothetical protein
MRDAVLRHPEDGLQVDAHHSLPPAVVGLQHRAVAVLPEDARVVVEDVERAEAMGRLVDHPLDVGLEGHVPRHGDGLSARPLDERHRLLGRGLVDVGHADPGAVLGEQDGRLPAHPHAGAGDERHLPREPRPEASPVHRHDPSSPSVDRIGGRAE